MSTTPATLAAQSGSSRLYHFDFSRFSELLAGEAILTAEVTADDDLAIGTPVINGPLVQARISGGEEGATYEVACAVTTSGGSALSQAGYLAVGGGGPVVAGLGLEDGSDYLGLG
jgi:hypothetical protein